MWHTSWCEKHCQIDNIDNVSTPTLGLHNMYILKKSFVVRDVKPPYILPLGCVMCDTLCMDTILSSSWWKLIGDNLFCIQWCCLLIWDWALTWISAWVLLADSSTKVFHARCRPEIPPAPVPVPGHLGASHSLLSIVNEMNWSFNWTWTWA